MSINHHPPYISSPLTLYGHVTGFFMKIYRVLEKSHKFPVKKSCTMII